MSWPTPGVVKLIDAMVEAEGGRDAFVRAVRCSIPNCTDYIEARDIAANTIAHALWDFLDGEKKLREFILFLGSRWAPLGTDNDPTNLNRNWAPNVLASFKAHGGNV